MEVSFHQIEIGQPFWVTQFSLGRAGSRIANNQPPLHMIKTENSGASVIKRNGEPGREMYVYGVKIFTTQDEAYTWYAEATAKAAHALNLRRDEISHQFNTQINRLQGLVNKYTVKEE